MDSKYCSQCLQKLPPSSFLANAAADPGSKVFKTCIACRGKSRSKRKALQPLHPNIPSKRRVIRPVEVERSIPPPKPAESRLESSILPPLPESRPKTPTRIPTPPPPS